MMAVNTIPANTPKNGLLNKVKMFTNIGESVSGLTAPLIIFMPYIKMANPKRMPPISRRLPLLGIISKMAPNTAKISEKLSGFNNRMMKLSPSKPVKLRIHDVTVVPMLEPMMTPMAWDNCMMPEFTKPTSITVTAEED